MPARALISNCHVQEHFFKNLMALVNFARSGTGDSTWIVTALPLVSKLLVSEQFFLKISPVNHSG
jgi:hypothetical protein